MTYIKSKLNPFGILLSPEKPNLRINDLPPGKLRDLAREHQLVVVRGFKTISTADSLVDYCETLGEVSIWPFGKVLELVEHPNPSDHIFDHSYVPLHWDGMYRQQIPEFQVFHCVKAPNNGHGGETTFSNTAMALQNASDQDRKLWQGAVGIYRRKMQYYDSKTVAPIINAHPINGSPIIRYNEPPIKDDDNFINHPNIEIAGISMHELDKFHWSLRIALYNPKNFYAHRWHTGDIVISDNYTLLHGRNAFTSGAARHIRRVHILGEPALNNPHLVQST